MSTRTFNHEIDVFEIRDAIIEARETNKPVLWTDGDEAWVFSLQQDGRIMASTGRYQIRIEVFRNDENDIAETFCQERDRLLFEQLTEKPLLEQ